MTDNRALVADIYAAANRGDLDFIAGRLHPDVVMHQAPSLPYGGEFVGRDAVLATLVEMFVEHYEVRELRLENLAVDDDLVIGCATLRAGIRATGAEIEMPFRECFRLRGGLVVDVRPFYYDTAALAAAFTG